MPRKQTKKQPDVSWDEQIGVPTTDHSPDYGPRVDGPIVGDQGAMAFNQTPGDKAIKTEQAFSAMRNDIPDHVLAKNPQLF